MAMSAAEQQAFRALEQRVEVLTQALAAAVQAELAPLRADFAKLCTDFKDIQALGIQTASRVNGLTAGDGIPRPPMPQTPMPAVLAERMGLAEPDPKARRSSP
jgi:hypothetical protein